jgi:ribosome-associated protein
MGNDHAAGDIFDIEIRDDMIRLGQLLKLASLVEDGVEAAELIKNGLVKVNGEIEERRGRQLHAGDAVTVQGETVRIATRS